MSTTPRNEFKITTKDHLAGIVIDSYIIEDNWSNCKVTKRHIDRLVHSTMSNILCDAMYDYDDKIEYKIHENGLGGYIKVNGTVRYSIIAYHIEVYEDNYRTYRDFGITLIEGNFYITQLCNGKVIEVIAKSLLGTYDLYKEIYALIDAKYGD